VVEGRNVVIVDDVMTSGSTLKKGVSLLRAAGSGRVTVACVARTEGKAKKDKNSR
jgi:predicted amidophosphoribosyltransferase